MRAILKKEWAQYFRSPIGYVYLGAFWCLCGLHFTLENMLAQTSAVSGLFQNMLVILMFLLPMLTMRTFSEETRQRTNQLLLTAPVSATEIVLGKFLACMAILGVGLLGTVPYHIVAAVFGEAYVANAIGGYLAVLLVSAALVALGILISSLTDSQIIAAVVSYCLVFILWASDSLAAFFQGNLPGHLLSCFAILRRFQSFSIGIFDPAAVVYYVSICGLFLSLTAIFLGRSGRRKADV